MIERIYIDGYKSFREFELEMKPLMVVFGPNGSGKSNLFDALQLMSNSVQKKSFKEAFEAHRGLPLESLSWLRGPGPPRDLPGGRISFEADVGLSEQARKDIEKSIAGLREGLPGNRQAKSRVTEHFLRYRLDMEVMRIGETRVADESLVALTKRKPRKQRQRTPFFSREDDKLVRRMEGQGHPSRLDLGMDHTLVSEPFYLPHHPHMAALREEMSRWRFYYLDPRKMMREDSPIKPIETMDPDGSGLAGFFFTLKEKAPLQFDNIRKSLRLLLPYVKDVDIKRNEEQGTVRIMMSEEHSDYPPRLVSEGTLRVLGLFAIFNALSPPSVVGFEEPENGVHPERLGLVAEFLRNQAESGTQVIVNSHSPEFVEQFDVENLFVCGKDEKGATRIAPLSSFSSLYLRGEIRDALREVRSRTWG